MFVAIPTVWFEIWFLIRSHINLSFQNTSHDITIGVMDSPIGCSFMMCWCKTVSAHDVDQALIDNGNSAISYLWVRFSLSNSKWNDSWRAGYMQWPHISDQGYISWNWSFPYVLWKYVTIYLHTMYKYCINIWTVYQCLWILLDNAQMDLEIVLRSCCRIFPHYKVVSLYHNRLLNANNQLKLVFTSHVSRIYLRI